jgi:hypothetical protein
MYEREAAFYKAHKTEFHKKYPNKCLVIVGDSLFGAYDGIKEAIESATKQYKPGEFMMHLPALDGKTIPINPFMSVHYE